MNFQKIPEENLTEPLPKHPFPRLISGFALGPRAQIA